MAEDQDVPEQKVVCMRCGSVRTDRIRKGPGPLCSHCEAMRERESSHVWVGRNLVRRPEEDD